MKACNYSLIASEPVQEGGAAGHLVVQITHGPTLLQSINIINENYSYMIYDEPRFLSLTLTMEVGTGCLIKFPMEHHVS